MSSALGVLKWSPKEFWSSTVYEYTSAMRGHLKANGVNVDGDMTREEFLKLKEEDEKRLSNS